MDVIHGIMQGEIKFNPNGYLFKDDVYSLTPINVRMHNETIIKGNNTNELRANPEIYLTHLEGKLEKRKNLIADYDALSKYEALVSSCIDEITYEKTEEKEKSPLDIYCEFSIKLHDVKLPKSFRENTEQLEANVSRAKRMSGKDEQFHFINNAYGIVNSEKSKEVEKKRMEVKNLKGELKECRNASWRFRHPNVARALRSIDRILEKIGIDLSLLSIVSKSRNKKNITSASSASGYFSKRPRAGSNDELKQYEPVVREERSKTF